MEERNRGDLQEALARGSRLVLGETVPPPTEAEAALKRLLEGNALYRSRERNDVPLTELIRLDTAHNGQHPRAAVVCCADSRVPAEHIFHAGIGELFVIRNAGNVMTPAALGSVEYAVGHLHVPLVAVMGHRGCGAVASALVHGQEGHHQEEGALGDLIARVAGAIGRVHSPAEAELRNLEHSISALGDSPLLRRLALAGQVGFAALMYDIRSGAAEPV